MKILVLLLGLMTVAFISCTNEMKTHSINTDPQAEEIQTPNILEYSAGSISNEQVKIIIEDSNLIGILYTPDDEDVEYINPIETPIAIDINNLSLYEELSNIQCPRFTASIELRNLHQELFQKGDTLFEGIISIEGEKLELDCVNTENKHFVVTFYNRSAINTERQVNIDTKIIFTENTITGVLGIRRASDPITDNEYIFF